MSSSCMKSDASSNSFYPTSIDHIAIAVGDLQASVHWFRHVLGFALLETRTVQGVKSGMISAVLRLGGVTIVLMQGTSAQSQISRYVEKFGNGVQHVAFCVDNVSLAMSDLMNNGLPFDTDLINSAGLTQAFTKRDSNTGLMIELISRSDHSGFEGDNIQSLFEQLEKKDAI
jgi:methylmalonyl-CoA/ethylmalonyl-CoA epimerase